MAEMNVARNKKYEKYSKKINKLFGAFFAYSLLLLALGVYFSAAITPPYGYMLLYALVFFYGLCIIAFKDIIKKVKQSFGKEIVLPILREYLPKATFYAFPDFDVTGEYCYYGLIEDFNSKEVSNLIFSNDEYELVAFSCSTKNGKNSYIYTSLLGINLNTGIKGVVRILCSQELLLGTEATFVPKYCSETPEKIETGIMKLDKYYEIYASDKHTAFLVLNSVVIEKLQKLRNIHGEYALVITPDRIFLALNQKDRFITLPEDFTFVDDTYNEEIVGALIDLLTVIKDVGYAISRHV